MASLHHATATAVLTFLILVSGAGIVPGTGATSVDGQTVSVRADAVDAMRSVDSYRAVTSTDVSIGANRTFTNVTTLANRSMAAATVHSTDSDEPTYVVGDRRYPNTSDGWRTDPATAANGSDPVRVQIALLNGTRVSEMDRVRIGNRTTVRLELAPRNRTLAGMLAAQPGNGVERAESVTILDRSYEIRLNQSTDRIERVEMTLKFRHHDEIGRATSVTWFGGYDRTVPPLPDGVTTAD
jgi:hypothetical protein